MLLEFVQTKRLQRYMGRSLNCGWAVMSPLIKASLTISESPRWWDGGTYLVGLLRPGLLHNQFYYSCCCYIKLVNWKQYPILIAIYALSTNSYLVKHHVSSHPPINDDKLISKLLKNAASFVVQINGRFICNYYAQLSAWIR